ncbi:MAG: signal peptide peptidase SppA [Myxococcota bacterium]
MAAPLDTARRVVGGLSRWARGGIARRALRSDAPVWAHWELDAPPAELPLPGPHGLEGLLPVLRELEIAADADTAGLRLELRAPVGGLACAEALRRALDAWRDRGKPIVVWAEMLDLASLYVAAVADRLWMPETGRLSLYGLRAEGFYLKDALDRWDVNPEVVRIGTHKSAGEMFTRRDMSDAQREQLDGLLDVSFDTLTHGIASGRDLDPAAVRGAIDAAVSGARDARELGLIDDLVYRDAWDASFEAEAPRLARSAGRPVFQPLARVAAGGAAPPARDAWREPLRLAYLVAEGSLGRGEGARGIASETWEARLAGLAADPQVRAVVLRIDSPGGDALASDLLWRALRALRREKPLVASIGGVAASGGYYLACAADQIFAERTSVTGSIGVIGGKLDLSGLYERLGIGRDGVERGARAGMLSETRGFRDDEREAVAAEMQELYRIFLERVAEGRGTTVDAIAPIAEGRVYAGADALKLGLVDRLGGPLEAIAEARRLAGVHAGEPLAIEVHPKPTPWASLAAWSRRIV